MFSNCHLDKEQKKIIRLASVGGMLEFYDFTIYGLFAVYFAGQFFPSNNNFITIVSSYAVFLIGYIARPLGGIIFSHIGDEIGRKTVMIITMVLMGVASLGLGLLPTYASIGLWAPVCMLLLRLLQGFGHRRRIAKHDCLCRRIYAGATRNCHGGSFCWHCRRINSWNVNQSSHHALLNIPTNP